MPTSTLLIYMRHEFVLLSIYYEPYCFQLYHYYCIKWEMKFDQSSIQAGWNPRKPPDQSPAHSMSISEVRPDCSGQSQKLPASLDVLFRSLAVLRKDHVFLTSDLSVSLYNFCLWLSAFHYALLYLSLEDFSSFQHIRKGNFCKLCTVLALSGVELTFFIVSLSVFLITTCRCWTFSFRSAWNSVPGWLSPAASATPGRTSPARGQFEVLCWIHFSEH